MPKKRVYIVKYSETHYRNFKVSATSPEEAKQIVDAGGGVQQALEFWNHDDARGVTVTWNKGTECVNFPSLHKGGNK